MAGIVIHLEIKCAIKAVLQKIHLLAAGIIIPCSPTKGGETMLNGATRASDPALQFSQQGSIDPKELC